MAGGQVRIMKIFGPCYHESITSILSRPSLNPTGDWLFEM